MMPRATHSLASFTALAVALAFAGCKQADTILVIEVAGPADVHPNQLRLNVQAPPDSHSFLVPAIPLASDKKMTFPTSFSISLDQSRRGPIRVSIDALDGQQVDLGFAGTTSQEHVTIGGQTIITVVLVEVAAPDQPDGGVDVGPDAAGSGAGGSSGGGGAGDGGGSGGSSGGGGAGGGAGASGAAGQGGAGGDAGLGLDGAAD
jgi:hypothetical protein